MVPSKIKKLSGAVVFGCLLATGVTLAAVHLGSSVSARDTLPREVEQVQLPTGVQKVHEIPGNIVFTEMATPPFLPNGHSVISRERAIQVAESNFNPEAIQPGAQVSASYGTYSNNSYAHILATGERQLQIQDRPVWFVRFTGIDIYPVGGIYYQLHPDALKSDANHEEDIVVDAETSQYLQGVTYQ